MAVDTKGGVFSGNLTDLSKQQMIEQAELFSEGMPALKDLMIVLWENGIQTIGSCSGHQGVGYPYVSFYADKMTDAQIRKILTEICLEMQDILQITINKGYIAENVIYDENSNVIGQEAFKRPLNIGISFEKDKSFDVNRCLEIFKNALKKYKDVAYYEEKFASLHEEDKGFIEDVVRLNHTNVSGLEITNIPNLPNATLGEIEIKKSFAGISYDNNLTTACQRKVHEISFQYKGSRRYFDKESGQVLFQPCLKEGNCKFWVDKNYYIDLSDMSSCEFVTKPVIELNGKYILNENGEVVEVSDEEIKARGLLSKKEYDEMIDKLRYGRESYTRIVSMIQEQKTNNESEFLNNHE